MYNYNCNDNNYIYTGSIYYFKEDNMSRRKSREAAMKLLFEISISKENYEDAINSFKENEESELTEIDMEYVEECLKTVTQNLNDIDSNIQKYLVNWKLERLSKIDLAILRICTYEINYVEDIPDTVSINEAVELAKKYSEDKSAAFINAAVDSMMKNK